MALRGRFDPIAPAEWADGGPGGDRLRVTPSGALPAVSLLHARAHRSIRSVAARFAIRTEAADPDSSVTFVCLAATGAKTDDLFRSGRSDQNRALGPGPPLPAQLEELHAIAGSRPVDVLILSLGCNDARCLPLLGELLRREIRCVDPLRLLAAYPTRRAWSVAAASGLAAVVDPSELLLFRAMAPELRRRMIDQSVDLIYDFCEAADASLASARAQIVRLAKAIGNDPTLARAEVLLLEYPDLTRRADGATAGAILDDLVPLFRVNRRELDLARELLLRPLNTMLRDAADRWGWTFVGGIFDAFESHGYAAADTWFVRAKESERIQGPIVTPVGYLRGEIPSGMLHPNERGHQAIADQLLRSRARRTTGPQKGLTHVGPPAWRSATQAMTSVPLHLPKMVPNPGG
jgi:hypothetical protein